MHAATRAQSDQIILIIEGRTWADKAHVAHQDAPELRQFIEASAAKKSADRREMASRIGHEMCRQLGRVDMHAAELRHQKDCIILSDSFGPIEGGTLGSQSNREGHNGEQRRQDDEQPRGKKDIKGALHDGERATNALAVSASPFSMENGGVQSRHDFKRETLVARLALSLCSASPPGSA
jgi:hypothetical protein